jgi:ketosteroid isomerase-like protein
MSQESVEMVRRAIEAILGGDTEAYLSCIAEDAEIYPDASVFPEAKPLIGREEFRRFLAEIDEGWEGGASLSEIREIFPVGDRVVVRADWGGRGQASGIDLHSSLTAIFAVRDKQIAKIEFFFDHAQALEAVGLSD